MEALRVNIDLRSGIYKDEKGVYLAHVDQRLSDGYDEMSKLIRRSKIFGIGKYDTQTVGFILR
jgi:hypothetical protein